jgi:WD40 repeat protein
MAFSQDGTVLATFGVEDGVQVPIGANSRDYARIQLWDVPAQKISRTLPTGHMTCRGLVFSKDTSSLLVVGDEGELSRLDVATGRKLLTMNPPYRSKGFTAISGDGSLMAGPIGNHEVVLWDLEKNQALKSIKTLKRSSTWMALDHTGGMLAVCLFLPKPSPEGLGDSIVLFDVSSGQVINEFAAHTAGVAEMIFSRDSRLLACRSSAGADYDHLCEIFTTQPARRDLASYFLRGWYAFDAGKLEIGPGVPAMGGSLNLNERFKYLQSQPKPPAVAGSGAVPSVTLFVGAAAPPSNLTPASTTASAPATRMEIKTCMRLLSSKATKSFLRFRIDVRNGETQLFVGGSVAVMLLGKRGGSLCLISKEQLPLDLKPLSTKALQSKTTDNVDISKAGFGVTKLVSDYVGYVCTVQDANGKVLGASGSTVEFEQAADRLVQIEAGDVLPQEKKNAERPLITPYHRLSRLAQTYKKDAGHE